MATENRGGSGNFVNDPQRASEAGRKGGEHSHQGQHSQSGGSGQQHGGNERGGSGNFANDPQRASEAGKKAANIAIRVSTVSPVAPASSMAAANNTAPETLPMIPSELRRPAKKAVNTVVREVVTKLPPLATLQNPAGSLSFRRRRSCA
jgi:general stress protein YciG